MWRLRAVEGSKRGAWALASGRLPEPRGGHAERPAEARARVLPRDQHRELRDLLLVVVLAHPREQRIVDVARGVRHRVGVLERHALGRVEERALRVVVQRVQLLRRDPELAAYGSIDVLSELAAVPPRDAAVDQPLELRVDLLEAAHGGPTSPSCPSGSPGCARTRGMAGAACPTCFDSRRRFPSRLLPRCRRRPD
jgi:hypothetical protein